MKYLVARSIWQLWSAARRSGVDVFDPDAEIQMFDQVLLAEAGLRHLADEPATHRHIIESVRAMELLHQVPEATEETVRLVATLPIRDHPVRRTRETLRELVRSASREVLVVGYTMDDGAFLELLKDSALSGAGVTIAGDFGTGSARNVWRDWPAAATPLRAFQNPEPQPGEFRSVHGKAVVVDGVRALVGSANFTLSGLSRNVELGVVAGADIASEIVNLVEALVTSGWLRPLS